MINMQYEIRKVAKNWQHPKKSKKNYKGDIIEDYIELYESFDESLEDFKTYSEYYLQSIEYFKASNLILDQYGKTQTVDEWCEYWIDYLNQKINEIEKFWEGRDMSLYKAEEVKTSKNLIKKYEKREISVLDVISPAPRFPDYNDYMDAYMPNEPKDCFQVYETISAGTPKSPVFSSLEDLKSFLLSNGWQSEDVATLIDQSGV
jgi:hypothetical protein